MHSHTISVHFRCPLLLFWLSFWCPICPICPHLSTLIFGCLHPDMPPRSMPQPVPRRPLRNLIRRTGAVSCRKNTGKIRFHRTVNHDILAIRFQPKQQTSGAVLFFAKKIPSQGIASPPTSSAETLPFSPSTACGFPSFKLDVFL
mgnify:CR=1 FL=1